MKAKKTAIKIAAAAALIILAMLASLLFYTAARLNTQKAAAQGVLRLPKEERDAVFAAARAAREEARFGELGLAERIVVAAPDTTERAPAPLAAGDIRARAACVIDAGTGSLLFEKNADNAIPPASLTKVASMYTAFHLMEESGMDMEARAELPPESWAVNLPPRSSLMFLAQGQRVTMKELFAGMAVPSGNDAAIAVALNTAGSLPAFVDAMNGEMRRLGLRQTRFVEPSGLSERNVTTAREYALFCKMYIEEYPQALEDFHSIKIFEYPKIWNIPAEAARRATADERGNTSQTVIQNATNRLLTSLEGCDGLKTGFIEESGFNFAVTCRRGGTRFIAVLLAGPGNTTAEGARIRAEDGARIMEWAFANFRTTRLPAPESFAAVAWGSKAGYVAVTPAAQPVFTVPANIIEESEPRLVLRGTLSAPIEAGERIGRAVWLSESGEELGSVELIAAERAERGSFLRRAADYLAKRCARLLGKA